MPYIIRRHTTLFTEAYQELFPVLKSTINSLSGSAAGQNWPSRTPNEGYIIRQTCKCFHAELVVMGRRSGSLNKKRENQQVLQGSEQRNYLHGTGQKPTVGTNDPANYEWSEDLKKKRHQGQNVGRGLNV